MQNNLYTTGVLDVSQLVEESLPTPKIRGSNPDIVNFFTNNCIEKTKIKEQRGREMPNLKTI